MNDDTAKDKLQNKHTQSWLLAKTDVCCTFHVFGTGKKIKRLQVGLRGQNYLAGVGQCTKG